MILKWLKMVCVSLHVRFTTLHSQKTWQHGVSVPVEMGENYNYPAAFERTWEYDKHNKLQRLGIRKGLMVFIHYIKYRFIMIY